jgi:NAD(P)-dependent dehydrogenase (short-subunit alcohol dehydrogenase family)
MPPRETFSSKQEEEMRMSKDGLYAIITGSASGLGAATAAILAKDGARIVVNYSNSKAEAEATADLCRKAGAEVVVVQGDVSRDEDCKKIAAAAASWGRLDILVNNAGTTKHVAHDNMDGLTAEDFQRIYAVNTIGPFQMIRRGQHIVGGRYFRRRLVGGLCREQGRAQHHHAIAGPRAGALDPRQHGMPGLYRYALVHQRPR